MASSFSILKNLEVLVKRKEAFSHLRKMTIQTYLDKGPFNGYTYYGSFKWYVLIATQVTTSVMSLT